MESSSAVRTKKRINIELPEILVSKLDELARKVNASRSELIRRFLIEKMAEKEKEEREQQMKEGYLANYDFIKESDGEWDDTIGDGL